MYEQGLTAEGGDAPDRGLCLEKKRFNKINSIELFDFLTGVRMNPGDATGIGTYMPWM